MPGADCISRQGAGGVGPLSPWPLPPGVELSFYSVRWGVLGMALGSNATGSHYSYQGVVAFLE